MKCTSDAQIAVLKRSQQHLPGTGHRIGDLSDVEPTVTQHHRTHLRTPSCLAFSIIRDSISII
jgi:hypothetical protein